ncbi:MAG: hypothetical protein KJ065_14145 [Anaerolineae bacterium]|nr:hypothetical protein [Anaerolineae bacterium]
MIFDWLAREGGYILSWWALATLMGAAALPLCWRLLGGLPDRGYTLARAAGILLTGYIFWLLGSFGFLSNTPGSAVLAWVIVLAISLIAHFTRRESFDVRAWWRGNRAVIITGELLFIGLLVAWAFVRAHLPDTSTTEKPMDLMYISAIMRSQSFPPNDAWMSGYAISYYYFGYFLAAMFGKLSGVVSTIAFSLNIAMLFALTALGAFGVVTNLVRARLTRKNDAPAATQGTAAALLTGLLAAVFVVLLGNFQAALIEVPYQSRTASEAYLAFWDTPERDEYPERMSARADGIADDQPITLDPGQDMLAPTFRAHWWWFRASRVLQDRDLDGTPIGVQPIDEFPQFSFVLADSHPHVMTLPYVLLAIGLALNILLRGRASNRSETILYGLAVGGLIFLNTWDGPIYLMALVGAEVIRRLIARRAESRTLDLSDWLALAGFGLAVLILAAVFYLPFLIGFRSQAAGLLPNVNYPTLFRQYFILFGPFLLILVPYLAVEVWHGRGRMNWRLGLQVVAVLVGAVVILGLFSLLVTVIAGGAGGTPASVWVSQIPEIIVRRITHGLTTVILLAGIAVIVARLFARRGTGAAYNASTGFALLLIGIGVSLTLLPEWVYLRDGFGVRANTVFKFYYQAWVVFALASAYAVYSLIASVESQELVPAFRALSGALAALALALGLVYPALAIYNRMYQESGRLITTEQSPLTLDGGPTFIRGDFDHQDYNAIMCLSALVPGDEAVVVEAVAGTYDPNVGRVAALTGIPVLFNWPGHERQWRGSTFDATVGTREQDIGTIYQSEDWIVIQSIIDRYSIDYIFFGTTERNRFGPDAEYKFLDRLPVVCQSGESRFYATGGAALASAGE